MITNMGGEQLLQKDAPEAAAAAPEAAGAEQDVLAQAEKRLKTYKTPVRTAMVQKLKAQYGFGDEVELALRLLGPDKFRELTKDPQGLEAMLSEAEDQNACLLAKIFEMGPEVE